MAEPSIAPVRKWLAGPMDPDAARAVERLRRAPDIQHVAVMPDVHLAGDACVGVAAATSSLIYPQAVGGDIGCGMLAVALDIAAAALRAVAVAAQVLNDLRRAVPALRRNRAAAVSQPPELAGGALSHASLESVRRNEGAIQFATLGSGNHFIELQADDDGRLWLLVHSGSRALGQAIYHHHLPRARPVGNGLRAFDARSDAGAAYLHDAACARRFAVESRRAMAEAVGHVLSKALGGTLCWQTAITADHNHVSAERRGGRDLWVHRKGAMPAKSGEAGVLPGSMGTITFHVEGRGIEESLCSSAHGAGRALSRSAARSAVTLREFRRQMAGVCYDFRNSGKLLDEAPSAYKDIRAVLRAQRELVKVTRTLTPALNYKGL